MVALSFMDLMNGKVSALMVGRILNQNSKLRHRTHTCSFSDVISCDTVDGRNPANQLRLVVYPIVYSVLYFPGG